MSIKLIEILEQQSPERRDAALRGLAHYLSHSDVPTNVYRLVDQSWMNAHFEFADGPSSFTADVRLAIEVAAKRCPDDLKELWRCASAEVMVGEATSQLSFTSLPLLARLGKSQDAINSASLIQGAFESCLAFAKIAEILIEEGATARAAALAQKCLAQGIGA